MHSTEPVIDWIRLPVSQTEHQPLVYDVSFLRSTKRFPCPFPGFLGSSHTCNGLRLHFISQHLGDRIRILEEHPNPLPLCERCGSQVPAGSLNTCHYAWEKCNQGEESRLRCKTLQHCFKASRVSSQINVETLPLSEDFPYLERTITYSNSD